MAQELRSHILILSDPNGSAHVGWAEMYDGRFIPALKTALEEDDDENGGIQQIVRCAMKTVVAACEAQIHTDSLTGRFGCFFLPGYAVNICQPSTFRAKVVCTMLTLLHPHLRVGVLVSVDNAGVAAFLLVGIHFTRIKCG